MRTRSPFVAIAVAGIVAASCAEKPVKTVTSAPTAASRVATPVVASQNCISLTQIRESLVRSDKVIDFVLVDGSVLRSRLPNACPQLGFERAFTYSTSLSQLCSVDIITVIIQGGGPMRGASCGLGQFTPIARDAAKAPLAPEDR